MAFDALHHNIVLWVEPSCSERLVDDTAGWMASSRPCLAFPLHLCQLLSGEILDLGLLLFWLFRLLCLSWLLVATMPLGLFSTSRLRGFIKLSLIIFIIPSLKSTSTLGTSDLIVVELLRVIGLIVAPGFETILGLLNAMLLGALTALLLLLGQSWVHA